MTSAPEFRTSDAPRRPALGDAVLMRWRKWDGGPHWLHECVYLGSDEHGDWIGQQSGWSCSRPGRAYGCEGPNVMLVPPGGEWVLMVNGEPHRVRVYIDVAWDVRWADTPTPSGLPEVTGIDMDLDVVRPLVDETFIDDEDEFAEHRVQYGYPLDIAERMEAVAADLYDRVRTLERPFDDATADRWLATLAELPADWPGHGAQ